MSGLSKRMSGTKTLLFAALSLCAGLAATQPAEARSLLLPMPPAQYGGKARVPVIERRAPISEVQAIRTIAAGGSSGAAPGSIHGTYILACSMVHAGTCYMVLPEVGGAISPETATTLRAHETGHCNGWPAHHPKVMP